MIESLGHYKVLEHVGTGGMGEVYRARDTTHGRTVAIKVLPAAVANDPTRRAQFLHDAHAAAALSHPSIVTLYEVGDDAHDLFLAFDFVRGETLKTTILGRPLHPRRAIDLAVQIADGLADAHAAGVVHRDIRPANIIVTEKGAAKILDLGLAAWTTGGTDRRVSPYRSPEQALGGPVDERADIFSLGAVLFELLTGKPPVNVLTSGGMPGRVGPAPAPSSVNRSLPAEIDGVVAKALAQNVDQRYQSAATLAAELRVVAAMLDVRSDATDRVPVRARPPRRSAGGWLVPAAAVAALAAAAWFLYGR